MNGPGPSVLVRALALVLVTSGIGCSAPKAPRFDYSWDFPVDFFPPGLEVPLAEGDSGVIDVYRDSDYAPVPLTSVTSDNSAVVRVDKVDSNTVQVTGLADGSATLTFKPANGSAPDSAVVSVEAIHRVEVELGDLLYGSHESVDSATLLQGGIVHVVVFLADAIGNGIVGTGTHNIAIDPPGAATLVAPADYDQPVILNSTGSVTLKPHNGALLTLPEVVPLADVASLDVDVIISRPPMTVGDVAFVRPIIQLADGRTAHAWEGVIDVSNDTPQVCTVTPFHGLFTVYADTDYGIDGVAAGDCSITFTLGGLTKTVDITVTNS